MNEKIELTKTNGTTIQADIICLIEDTSNSKRYIYYTLNELVGTGPSSTIKIYVGKVKQNDQQLDEPITDDEWNKLKGLMGEVLKNVKNDTIKYITLSDLNDRTIVNEKVIAMPTAYDYINKQRGIYAEAVANSESDESSGETLQPVIQTTIESNEQLLDTNPKRDDNLVNFDEISPNLGLNIISTEPSTSQNDNIEEKTSDTEISNTSLLPIDISEIETKYDEMIENINKLRSQEIEAAKRYNATIELNAMHNEQHASYIANEQSKEATPITTISDNSENITSISEPTPIIPTIPEPNSQISTNLETNWFDMPIQE